MVHESREGLGSGGAADSRGAGQSRVSSGTGVILVATAAASWGTWSLFLRPTHLPPTVTSPLVFLIIGLVLVPFAWREPKPVWDRRAVGIMLLNTASDATNLITFFGAMAKTTVAIAVLTHYMAPILVALAAPRIDRTRTRGAVPAAFVAVAGLVIMLEPWLGADPGAFVGALLGLASAVCYAANVFIVRRAAERLGTARAMSYHSLVAAVVMLPLAVSGLATVEAFDVGLLAAGSTTIGALSGVMFIIGLRKIGSARASILTFAEPVVAVTVGIAVWGEPLRPLAVVGGVLILAAGIHVAKQAR
jgi:drug/metabolite transporter, DME family